MTACQDFLLCVARQDFLLCVAQVSEQQQFLVRASFLEIYNEEVRDLLSKNPKNKLELKERKDQGVYVKGLNSFVVKSVAEITSVLEVSIHMLLICEWRLYAFLSLFLSVWLAGWLAGRLSVYPLAV